MPGYGGPAVAYKYLAADEARVVTLRMHPSVLIPPLLVGVGGLSAAIAISPILRDPGLELAVWLFSGLLLAQLGRAVFRWLSEYIVITQLRIFVCSGAGITSSSPLKQVDDVRVTRSVAGRVLGFGTLIFDSAHLAIENVPYPEQVYLEILALLSKE
jgi:hypothetical protein